MDSDSNLIWRRLVPARPPREHDLRSRSQLQPAVYDVSNPSMRLRGCTACIYRYHALWFPFGDGLVPFANSGEERLRFLFETILIGAMSGSVFALAHQRAMRRPLIALPRPPQAHRWIEVEQDRQIRLQVSAQKPMQL